MSFRDTYVECEMHLKTDYIAIIIGDSEYFESLLSRYQIGLEEPIKASNFVFDYFNLLFLKRHEINPYCGGTYIDFPDWIKNEKGTINPMGKNYGECLQCDAIVASNHKDTGKNTENTSKLKLL